MKKIIVTTACLATLIFGSEKPYEIGLTIGGTKAESDLKLDDHTNYGIRFGIENNLLLENIFDTVEFVYERSNGVDYKNTNLETDINRYSVNFLHSYKDFGSFVPYGLVGVGYEDFRSEYLRAKDSLTTNIGVGVKYYLNDALSLRAEIRDQINLEHSMQHEMIYSFGIGYAFGVEQPKKVVEKVEKPKVIKQKVESKVKLQETKSITQVVVQIDSDKDGILDINDKCPNTLQGCGVDTNGCAIDYTFDVNFAVDKYKVEDRDIEKLKKFTDFMNMHPSYKAIINGHTDSTGTEAYNMNLSLQRAKAVTNKLVELGLEKDRISYKGFGETKPTATNDTKEGRAQNRRVEAEIKR